MKLTNCNILSNI